ncbi:hypothetical protein BOX15_Mlig022478g2, partial [Macrostomum lignano]
FLLTFKENSRKMEENGQKKVMSARWEVPLSDRVHVVQFDHGTTSGRRAIFLNGECIKREDFMFKLVGIEHFKIGSTPCTIEIVAADDFNYHYKLLVNGKSVQSFSENQARILKCWLPIIDGEFVRIVLEKDSLDVYVDGKVVETAGEFTDEGTETHFTVGDHACFIRAVSSGKRRTGIIQTLFIDDHEVTEAAIDQSC